ncbi:MAG TPA: hypothetical protein VNI60_02210 [Pyrinomonadaceae bacterium]|nr:hypothetical protein [Pyrinomonadaceae bacterium]
MLYKNFFTLFLCLVFVGQTFAQTATKTSVKKSDIAPELQEKAVALLKILARDAEQFSLPRNRINARIGIAGLLWKPDEKQARIIYQNAVMELNTLINQIPPENTETEEEYTERYTILNDVRTLRNDLLVALGSHDPKFALESLQTLSRKDESGTSLFEDDQSLELKLAVHIAARDPKQAYELAMKNLENGIDANLFSTLENLYEKDPELGTKLTQEVAGKIKSKAITVGSVNESVGNAIVVNGSMSNVMIKSNQTGSYTVNTWDIQSFLNTVKKLNRQAEKNKAKAILSENEIKEIVDILAQKYVRQQYLSAYEVVKVMPEITKYFPAQATAIQRKIGQEQSVMLGNMTAAQNFQNETEGQSADEITQFIEKKSVAERDDLYHKAAETAYANGEIEEAKKFHDKIKTKGKYDYLDRTIENALPLALAGKGELREVRRMLAKLKTPEERIEILTALAASVARKGDKKSASALAGEARAMYSGRMKNRKNLASVLQIAQAYAIVDAEQGFAFLENNMSFFNDVIGAGILLDEFNEIGSVENDEARLDTVRSESYRNLSKGVALIKSLSTADFDRTIALAEKFSRLEVRFYARLRVAEALLNPDAETDEKEFQSNFEGEHKEY